MKKILLSFLALGVFITSFGQNDYKKRPALGIHFVLNDFRTATDLRTNGLASVLRTKEWHKTQYMSAGIGVSYMQGLSNHVDFAGVVSGSYLNYPVPTKPATYNKSLLLEGVATINLKLLTDKYWFNPFLTAGVGASKYRGYFGAFIPVGVGLQIGMWDETFLIFNSQYRMPVTENVAYHFYHSVGIAGSLKKKPLPPPVTVIPPPVINYDHDNDGVPDSTDRCPDVPGLASLKGCPDRDGDGIADIDDKCPDVFGYARYQGCPIPDTDKDGINDEEDKCPTVPGLARYQGCPIPDTDKDGVNDEEDKCINEPGPASNFGCPIIPEPIITKLNSVAKKIFFATGSFKLLPKSYKPLDEVVTIMNQNTSFYLNIEGHTDDVGKDDYNQTLSDNRAASVKAYLVSKGVAEDRLASQGFGETTPIADNKTVAGRAQNRRVELKVRNYK
jgi:OOP family OmpA-OmpF porin